MVVELVHTLGQVQDTDGQLEHIRAVEQGQDMGKDGRLEYVSVVERVQGMGGRLEHIRAVEQVRDMDILLVHLLVEEQAHKLVEAQLQVELCFEWACQQVDRYFEYKVVVPDKDKDMAVAPVHRTGTS